MKVLHLPYNIASQISITVRALRLTGVDARGLARKVSPIQDDSGIETVEWFGRPRPMSRLARGIRWRVKLVRAMAWADVLHWHWGDTTWRGLDLRIARWMRKPRLVEFWGGDIRDPEKASQDNPYIARMYELHPELANQCSRTVQALFRAHGFQALIPGYELSNYMDPALFPGYYQTRAGLLLAEYAPQFPDPLKKRPLLVHAPSNKSKKGTETLLKILERLRADFAFDFELVHQMARPEALGVIGRCDVFLDQFTIGAEGLASHEAMALGKPVICFIKDSLKQRYPPSLPILTADPAELGTAISTLLKDGGLRRELGLRGRRYMEEFHDARKLAPELIEVYEDLSNRFSQTASTAPASRCRSWRFAAKDSSTWPGSPRTEPCAP